MINTGIEKAIELKKNIKQNAKKYTASAWEIAKSDQTVGVIKIIGAGIALIHTIEEYKKSKRTIGFQ